MPYSIQQTEQIPNDPPRMGARSTTTSNHPSTPATLVYFWRHPANTTRSSNTGLMCTTSDVNWRQTYSAIKIDSEDTTMQNTTMYPEDIPMPDTTMYAEDTPMSDTTMNTVKTDTTSNVYTGYTYMTTTFISQTHIVVVVNHCFTSLFGVF